MKRLFFLILAVLLITFSPTFLRSAIAEDYEGGEKQENSENSSGGENTESGDPSNSGSNENPDEGNSNTDDPEPKEENADKTFVCAKCGYTNDSSGDCPACNVSLSEQSGDSGANSGDSTGEKPPDESGDSGDSSGNSVSEPKTD